MSSTPASPTSPAGSSRGPTSTASKYVGANIYTKGRKTPAMKSYEVYTVNGVRVGVVGAVTAETPNLVAGLGIAGETRLPAILSRAPTPSSTS